MSSSIYIRDGLINFSFASLDVDIICMVNTIK